MNPEHVYLLTGGASGIGLETADLLARGGARVVAADLDLEGLEAAAAARGWDPERVLLRHLDVRDAAAWEALVEEVYSRFGRLDALFNIAGVLKPGRVVALTPEDVDLHLDVNLKGVVHGTRLAARRMAERGGGHIVNMASMAALAPIPGIALYSASKYAVRAFSQATAEELRPHGVAVTAVCPDAVATPMLDLQKDFPEAALTFTAPRFLTPREVAEVLTGRVLSRRPVLVVLPRRRGWLARAADLFPWLGRVLTPRLTRRGLERQRRWPS